MRLTRPQRLLYAAEALLQAHDNGLNPCPRLDELRAAVKSMRRNA